MSTLTKLPSRYGLPLLLAIITFLVYVPSLKSDFVYDARHEILEEGFITHASNLPAVLTLRVLGMNLILGDRPGELLYLMVIALFCGREPFGYHLCSNLLHAANVALLFILLRRLITQEYPGWSESKRAWAWLAAAVAVLVFALHPVAVESVSEVSYASSLLVTFFTLAALLAVTEMRPENIRSAILFGTLGGLCALAAVMGKESGIAAILGALTYWYLFRRAEAKTTWMVLFSATAILIALFLAARFYFAPPATFHFFYIGGSFGQMLLIQPRLWVFMMDQMAWPFHLSADYTPGNSADISFFHSFVVLGLVILGQSWLAAQSRIGALGAALYWLGLVTVSNFVPLYHAVADRYYYLPLAGVAMQLTALLLLILKSPQAFAIAIAVLLIALVSLAGLTVFRQKVFANEESLWTDTLRVSPRSVVAHNSLGVVLYQQGKWDEARAHFQQALALSPTYAEPWNNLGLLAYRRGQWDEALGDYQKAIENDPGHAAAHNNLGLVYLHLNRLDDAQTEFEKAIEIRPGYADPHHNLVNVYLKKRDIPDAIDQLHEALRLNPGDSEARDNLARLESESGQAGAGP
ncbi:MAG: tetratricopeptide repeat protein [Methylacidiphilales bacterium]|nr:tetratricopeptide repeat protein [Candidatus Methylacidiphilales bacterium]